MAKANRISPLVLQEAFANGDEGFVDLFRQVWDAKVLVPIVQRWVKDFRPWAREQVVRYLRLPFNSIGHNIVVKHLFKHYEAQKDDEMMGVFMHVFDRMVRRQRRRKLRWNPLTRRPEEYISLRAPSNELINLKLLGGSASEKQVESWIRYYDPNRFRIFSNRTRIYLQRRAWRYFRRIGFQRPADYTRSVALALANYTDAELGDGLAVLDSWALFHACFGKSDAVTFTAYHGKLIRPAQLLEMVAPYFPELWQRADAANVLLNLITGAASRVVRSWAVTLMRRHHAGTLSNIRIEDLLRLIDHADPDVQQLGAELLASATGLENLDLDTWLRLLRTPNPNAIVSIAAAMRNNVRPDRLTPEQLVILATSEPAPVARLGLDFLKLRRLAPGNHVALAGLANARCESLGREIASFALAYLGDSDRYNVDLVSRFFDALLISTRSGAWDWLTPAAPGWNDPALWSRLIETPYDDVRLRLVRALEQRASAPLGVAPRRRSLPGLPIESLAAIWIPVLLAIQRGGRAKLTALRQISDAVRAHPEHAELLIPVLAIAIRSVRLPEARAGLAAVVAVLATRPELETLVRRHLPELSLEGAVA